MNNNINLIITDLDDTIWDWLSMWYNSFNPYLQNIHELTKIDLETLKCDFKKLHQKYGTSEVSFAYQELTSLTKEQKDLLNKNRNGEKSIIHQYYHDKKVNLKMYDGVLTQLKELKSIGVKLVGFTESNSFYTKYRIKTLDIDGLFDVIYTPDDHGLPEGVIKYYEEDYWEPKLTKFEVLPKNFVKPDPIILMKIIIELGGKLENTIYIGDKLDRDVHMANKAQVTSVYAKYGHQIDTASYALLRQVTHWTKEDVEREKVFKEQLHNVDIKPNFTINNFKEIQDLFQFCAYEFISSVDDYKNRISIWAEVIRAQEHFNDLEMRIRNFGITILGALLTIAAFSLKEKIYPLDLPLIGEIHIASIIIVVALLVWLAFYYMDQHWYHILLYGSVKHAEFIEDRLKTSYPEILLAKTISRTSHKKKFFGFEINSKMKMRIYYLAIGLALLIMAVLFSAPQHKNHLPSSKNERFVLATLWMQTAAECKALQAQSYNIARNQILQYLNNNNIQGNEAVIVDVDDTILETSLYQVKMIDENLTFPDGWEQFLNRAICKPVTGSLEFLNFVDSLGIKIFYISNRTEVQRSSLMKNLINVGFPQIINSRILLKNNTNSKEERRDHINSQHNVILLIGDNLADFSELFSNKDYKLRLNSVISNIDDFGSKFILLPNPTYGDWESALSSNYWKVNDIERDSIRKSILKKIID